MQAAADAWQGRLLPGWLSTDSLMVRQPSSTLVVQGPLVALHAYQCFGPSSLPVASESMHSPTGPCPTSD